MKRTSGRTPAITYRGLFPDWEGRRPLSYFFMEQLLEARAASFFPTNGAGPDEDVNVYLAHLLTELALRPGAPDILFGSGPQWQPPAKDRSRYQRAQWYRLQGDHRLLCLGLFGRGEDRRVYAGLAGMTQAQARRRDMVCGRSCYQSAADLLQGRSPGWQGQAEVLRKLADRFDDYVHVVGVLGVRRLGLRTVLSEGDLQSLLGPRPAADAAVAAPGRPRPAARLVPGASMDDLLDLWLEHRNQGTAASARKLQEKARQLGVPQELLEMPEPEPPARDPAGQP